MGYYTLTMASIDLNSFPKLFQKSHGNSNVGGLIARLAVDKRYKGKGYGKWLLIDALKKMLAASESIGFPLVVVNAKEGVAQFYEKFGFQSFQDHPDKLFITASTIRNSLRNE